MEDGHIPNGERLHFRQLDAKHRTGHGNIESAVFEQVLRNGHDVLRLLHFVEKQQRLPIAKRFARNKGNHLDNLTSVLRFTKKLDRAGVVKEVDFDVAGVFVARKFLDEERFTDLTCAVDQQHLSFAAAFHRSKAS
ncbi:MAG: hypothetical protein V8T51_03630 [Senegalimassilia faecalis]